MDTSEERRHDIPVATNESARAAADAAFVERIGRLALARHAATGTTRPYACIETSSGRLAGLDSLGLESIAEKTAFIALTRFASIRLTSPRAAVVLGAWTIDAPRAEAERWVARGNAVRDHERAVEHLYVIVESDLGSIVRSYEVRRTEEDAVVDGPPTDRLIARNDGTSERGALSGFHVHSRDRLEATLLSQAIELDPMLSNMLKRVREA